MFSILKMLYILFYKYQGFKGLFNTSNILNWYRIQLLFSNNILFAICGLRIGVMLITLCTSLMSHHSSDTRGTIWTHGNHKVTSWLCGPSMPVYALNSRLACMLQANSHSLGVSGVEPVYLQATFRWQFITQVNFLVVYLYRLSWHEVKTASCYIEQRPKNNMLAASTRYTVWRPHVFESY